MRIVNKRVLILKRILIHIDLRVKGISRRVTLPPIAIVLSHILTSTLEFNLLMLGLIEILELRKRDLDHLLVLILLKWIGIRRYDHNLWLICLRINI